MARAGKYYVMSESARIGVAGYGSGEKISFNKYSGVQEWGNDVLFLWVNLGAPKSDVVNEFFDEGQKITWFGGSRMRDGSPVIQKLVHVGSRADVENSPFKGVVLWCRKYLLDRRTFSAYVCLGRLSVSRPGLFTYAATYRLTISTPSSWFLMTQKVIPLLSCGVC